jgi:predicted N-formylglutamate amidohydrolase
VESDAWSSGLLVAGDPPPFIVANAGAVSPFLLLGDHAGRSIPARLGDLGLAPGDLDRHIAWDIGVAGLGERLSAALDAYFIRQTYSRLVIDCNRTPGSDGSIVAASDGAAVPGNARLSEAEAQMRLEEIYRPYQEAIAAELDARRGPTLLVALHSFTPSMNGADRPWRYGVVHRGDSPFSFAVLALLQAALGEAAGDNLPYGMGDGTDNTIPLHADARGLDYLEIEVRQDLLADPAGQDKAARFLGPILVEAERRIRRS